MPLGYLSIVLHAHLPFVRHPEHPRFLEEEWFYEALTETYLPLLAMLDGWRRDHIPGGLTISISPTLAAMLADGLLQSRYAEFLDRKLVLAHAELERLTFDPARRRVAAMYRDRLTQCRTTFVERYAMKLLPAFAAFAAEGLIELATCAATHAFLPLFQAYPEAIARQVEEGCRSFETHFGRRPQGFWLPECGYYPGVDRVLADAGIRWTALDTHGILHANPRPRYGAFAPLRTPHGVAAFGRDRDASERVWSAAEGYPGDPAYREFHHDIANDLPWEYLEPHQIPGCGRHPTGFKYDRITGGFGPKEPYDPDLATRRAVEHAADFLFGREKQADWLSGPMNGRPALLFAPYDAELFGHWWYEGPIWLDALYRMLAVRPEVLEPITPTAYLSRHGDLQRAEPAFSSWGNAGYCEMWLNPANDWIWPPLHAATERTLETIAACPGLIGRPADALRQLERELYLAQASDWPFILRTGTMTEYAHKRVLEHLENVDRLIEMLTAGAIDETVLSDLERRHNLFM